MKIERVDHQWDNRQNEAIARCLDMQTRVVPITGAAGTGKTSIIHDVFWKLTHAGYSVVIAAPTGKAARRITEATGIEAKTIHRLLEYTMPGQMDHDGETLLIPGEPQRNKSNRLDYQVVLIDEYAMVNNEMHRNIIHALPAGGRLCAFGDMNQLPPIEKGALSKAPSPFKEILRAFKGVELETIHRTKQGSGIAENGYRILNKRLPVGNDDFDIVASFDPIRDLERYLLNALERGINFGSNGGQVICPTKKTMCGTHSVNLLMQRIFNPNPAGGRVRLDRSDTDKERPVSVGVGDKVIWTENAYDLRPAHERLRVWENDYGAVLREYIMPGPEHIVMNGETGIVVAIHFDDKIVTDIMIDFGDRVVKVPRQVDIPDPKNKKGSRTIPIRPFKKVDLGFCITTHKAQGSEWPHVIYMLNKVSRFMQTRFNLYTAITRASERCAIISDPSSLQYSVNTTASLMERK